MVLDVATEAATPTLAVLRKTSRPTKSTLGLSVPSETPGPRPAPLHSGRPPTGCLKEKNKPKGKIDNDSARTVKNSIPEVLLRL